MKKEALFKISYGLYVLTSRDEEKDNGCIINTFMQISDNPLTGIVSINKSNYTNDMVKKTGKLNVSMLSTKANMEIFKRFGFQSGKDVDKFENFSDMERGKNGIYYVTGCANSYISGEVLETYDFDTHNLFKIKLVDGEIISDENSLTYEYYHENIKPKPEAASEKKGWRCKICSYIYEGENLPEDYICPICKHGASDFEKI